MTRYFTQDFVQDRPMPDLMQDLALEAQSHPKADTYISGGAISALEDQVRTLLGLDAAAFFITGTMAQQIALRIHAHPRTPVVGVHPFSHLVWNENNAISDVSGLGVHLIGDEKTNFHPDDLAGLEHKIGALSIELPLRNTGGHMPRWEELVAMSNWCRASAIPFHLDGARLWEAQPFYKRPFTEITALFDSVYVSFYKGLGGFGGAMLLGNAPFIDEARTWRHTYGGNVFAAAPYALSALQGLKTHLPSMPARHARAKELATIINGLDGFDVPESLPHANILRVDCAMDATGLNKANEALEQSKGLRLFRALRQPALPHDGLASFEIHVGANTLAFSLEESRDLLHSFHRLCHI